MPITDTKRRNRVFKSLHKPLTVLGIERGLFFVIAMASVAVFNLFASFLAAIVVFAVGFMAARMATEADPKILTILARSERLKARYDAMKQEFPKVVVRNV
ncbi:MAG TPA: VirB3 family type IV secretion system protein [Candidatus Angelobacter sp.]|nr:VirB3 family type IV secretion system protein [Candidatus Angelobacter sp.]